MDFRKGRAAAASLLVASILAVYGQTPRGKVPVSRRSLCVTEGTVGSGEGHQLTVDDPKVRAYVNGWTSQAVETQFTYLGSTTVESRLESGEFGVSSV